MKTSEFKKILKPLVEQTVREVLLSEGVLSKVVSEVARGMRQPLKEEVEAPRTGTSNHDEKEYEEQRQKRIKRLNESSGMTTDIFNNVKSIPESDPGDPLSGLDATDAGIDISDIQKLSNGKWKTLVGGK